MLDPSEKIPCSLETLTPVHVGSGVKLRQGFDFYTDYRSTTTIISESLLSEFLRNNPEYISEFDRPDFTPVNLLKKINGGKTYNLGCNSPELVQCERNGFGIPYLPGSSLKGAIRTAYLKNRFLFYYQSLPPQTQANVWEDVKRNASSPINKKILGEKPNEDIFRALSPGDIHLNEQFIDLKKVLILNLTNPNGKEYGWKDVKGRTTLLSPDYATQIFAEMVAKGTVANFSIRMNSFLTKNNDAEKELHFSKYNFSIGGIAKIINRHSREMLTGECTFLKNLPGKALNGLITNTESLLSHIPVENSDRETSEFVLRMSWGSGWKSMTGDLVDERYWGDIRQKFHLGRGGFTEFPKTRKIVFENDEPSYLSGWVRVRLKHTATQNVPQPLPQKQQEVKEKTTEEKLEAAGFRIGKKR